MAVSKSALDENKQQQDMQQPLHPRVGKAQRRRALSIDYDRPLQVLERCFADEAVVADALDVKQTSVGRKANLAQFGRFSMRRPMSKSRVSLMVVSVRSACPSL